MQLKSTVQLKFFIVFYMALCAYVFAARELSDSTSRELQQNQGSDARSTADSIISSIIEDRANTTRSSILEGLDETGANITRSTILVGSGGSGAVASASSFTNGDSTESSALAVARTSRGSVEAESAAFSTATAEEEFTVAITNAVIEVESGDGDAIALAEVAARAFAVAIAEAYAETSVTIISIQNGALFCGTAFAEAGSSATASARVLVNVLARASDKISFVDSEGAIEAIQDVTVNAFSSAESTACVDGVGQAEATSSQLSQAIGVAFAEVTALALAVVTPEVTETEIIVEITADDFIVTTVDGSTATDVLGVARASANATAAAGGEGR